MNLIPPTNLSVTQGQVYETAIFSIVDDAKSVRVTLEDLASATAPANVLAISAEVWLSINNGPFLRKYACGVAKKAPGPGGNPYGLIGLDQGPNEINRRGKVVLHCHYAATFRLYAENSVTVGTPNQGTAFGVTQTISVDAGAGSDRCMLAFDCIPHTAAITSLTYNGVTMTHVTGATSGNTVAIYRALNPATGAHNLVADHGVSNNEFMIAGVPLSGVDQGTPNRTPPTPATGTGGTTTVTATSATGDLVIDGSIRAPTGAGMTYTIDGSQTNIFTTEITPNTFYWVGISSKAGAASVVMNWTSNQGGAWYHSAVSMIPAGAAPPATGGASSKITRGIKRGINRGMNP